MKKRFLGLLLALSLVLSLCACTTGKTPENHADPQTASPAQTDPPVVLDESVQAIIGKEVSFSAEELAAVREAVDVRVDYPYQELYGIWDSYERYLTLTPYTSSHENYFADGSFTADELYAIVKANNDAAQLLDNRVLEDKDLEQICAVVAPVLEQYGVRASDEEAALLSEKIDELTMIRFQEFAYAFYDSAESRMGVDVTRKEEDAYTNTIIHETYHMIQGSSVAENTARQIHRRNGYSVSFEDSDDEPLLLRWITEGSAELLAQNYQGSRDYQVYQSCIRYIDFVKVATIPDPDIDDTTFEELTLTEDFQALFDYFGCTTQQEQQEVLNMLCAVNYLQNLQNCADPFFERYESTYGNRMSIYDLRPLVENSLGQSMTKCFFRNLSEQLEGKTLSVEEVFLLCSFFEHRICDILLIHQPEEIQETLLMYQKAQKELFAVLAQQLGVEADEIRSAYDTYYTDGVLDAGKISILTEAEAAFLQYTTDTAVNPRYRSVDQVLQRSGILG